MVSKLIKFRLLISLLCFAVRASVVLAQTAAVDDDLLAEIFGTPTTTATSAPPTQSSASDGCFVDADCPGKALCDLATGVCDCPPPFEGENCDQCKMCEEGDDCDSLFACVQCEALNFFWDSDLLESDCPDHCRSFAYARVAGDASALSASLPPGVAPCVRDLSLAGRARCRVAAGPPIQGEISYTEIDCGKKGSKTLTTDEGEYVGTLSKCKEPGKKKKKTKMADGFGTLTFFPEDPYGRAEYVGEFSCGARHGRGTMRWADSAESAYAGDFESGVRRGRGRMRYASGHAYVGGWENDTRHGDGMYWGERQIYVGEFDMGFRHGVGEEYETDGDLETPVFEGLFERGHRKSGVLKISGGDVYEGEFKDGTFHGYGVFDDACGNEFRGEWTQGKRNGNGTYLWISGQIYEGEWEDDVREGRGSLTWTNGERYEGEFSSDAPHGEGVLYWMDGSMFAGRFENGEATEDGVYVDAPPPDSSEEN